MIKQRLARAIVCAVIVVVGAVLILKPSRERQVWNHLDGWHEAMTNASTGTPVPWLGKVREVLRDGSLPLSGSDWYWLARMNEHEQRLLQLGYLTNCVFSLEGQKLPDGFSSNLLRRIYARVGNGGDQVWKIPRLTNGMGISPTFPAKDYAVWEQAFRESASLPASNSAPVSVHPNGSGGAAAPRYR